MSEPLVSVVMAVFNARRTVGCAVESLLSQTHRNLEIICVDDGSSDESLAILRDYAARDARVRVIAAAHAGATAALNAGLAAAKGDFIGFLDNDDRHHPRTFELALRAFGGASRDIVVWDWRGIGDESFEQEGFLPIPEAVEAADLQDKVGWGMGDHHVSFWCKLYRREVLEGVRFDPSVIHGDVVFYWRLWIRPEIRAAHLPLTLTHYRKRAGSVMHSPMTVEKAIDLACVIRRVAENAKGQPEALLRLKRSFFPERIWSVYKITRRQPELRAAVLPWLRDLMRDGIVRWRDMRIIRAIKMQLAFLTM